MASRRSVWIQLFEPDNLSETVADQAQSDDLMRQGKIRCQDLRCVAKVSDRFQEAGHDYLPEGNVDKESHGSDAQMSRGLQEALAILARTGCEVIV